MLPTCALALVVVLVLVAASAQPTEARKAQKQRPLADHPGSTQHLQFDQNAAFDAHDKNGDGVLDNDEVNQMYQEMHEGMGTHHTLDHTAAVELAWKHMDGDGDKLISRQEYKDSFASGLSARDIAGKLRVSEPQSEK